MRGRRRGQRVPHVMLTGHAQGHAGKELAVVISVVTAVGAVFITDITRRPFRVVRGRIPYDPFAGNALHRLRSVRVVRIDNQCAGCQLSKGTEGADDAVKGAEIVEMVGVDIEDDGYGGGHGQVMILKLARLADHDIAFSRPAVGPNQGQPSADEYGGVQLRLQ